LEENPASIQQMSMVQHDQSGDLSGEKLGSFTLLSLAGEGNMAKVYRARHQRHNREMALKVFSRIPGRGEDTERFQREKKALEKLTHPHIMPIEEFSGNSSYLWIASPLIDGGTLADRLQSGPMSMEKVAEAAGQIAEALDFAHQMHIIHRDLKPSNILVEQRQGHDHYYLADFGVAKVLEAEGLTMPGMTVGTPDYMSPEQVLGKKMDGRSDQYALGILCYQLATGHTPFQGDLMTLMQSHAKTAPPPPTGVGPEVARVLLRVLAKEPSQRYASCGEFADALEKAVYGSLPESDPQSEAAERVGDGPLSSPPPGMSLTPPRRRRSFWRRSRGLLATLAAAALALGLWFHFAAGTGPTPSPSPSETPTPTPTSTHHPKPKPKPRHSIPRRPLPSGKGDPKQKVPGSH
jgi:serine/threonine-protein kinase